MKIVFVCDYIHTLLAREHTKVTPRGRMRQKITNESIREHT